MLRYLLDTNIVSQPAAKTPAASVLRKLRNVGDQCAIAIERREDARAERGR